MVGSDWEWVEDCQTDTFYKVTAADEGFEYGDCFGADDGFGDVISVDR